MINTPNDASGRLFHVSIMNNRVCLAYYQSLTLSTSGVSYFYLFIRTRKRLRIVEIIEIKFVYTMFFGQETYKITRSYQTLLKLRFTDEREVVVEMELQRHLRSPIKQFTARSAGKSILITIFSTHFSFLCAVFSFPRANCAVLQFAILLSQNNGENLIFFQRIKKIFKLKNECEKFQVRNWMREEVGASEQDGYEISRERNTESTYSEWQKSLHTH